MYGKVRVQIMDAPRHLVYWAGDVRGGRITLRRARLFPVVVGRG